MTSSSCFVIRKCQLASTTEQMSRDV